MSIAIRAEFEEVRRIAFGDISAVFAGIGTKFDHPVRMILLHNMTDVALTFSDDGVKDKFDLNTGSSLVLDLTSNKTIEQGFTLAQGTRLYVRDLGVAAGSGMVSLSVIYGTTGY